MTYKETIEKLQELYSCASKGVNESSDYEKLAFELIRGSTAFLILLMWDNGKYLKIVRRNKIKKFLNISQEINEEIKKYIENSSSKVN